MMLKTRFPDVLIQREIVEVRDRQSNMGKGWRRKSAVGSFHVTTYSVLFILRCGIPPPLSS